MCIRDRSAYDLVLQTGIYKDHLDNSTDTNLLRASKVSLIFDRVDNNILQAKTYSTAGASGVDSRTVHHELLYTDLERLYSAVTDLNSRATVGDLVVGNPSDHASQRIVKYNKEINPYLASLATMKLTVDDNIKNHPIIVANTMSTLTTLTYDQLQGADVYYRIANGYHEDLTLTVAEAVQRYDYDINSVLRTGTNVKPGTATDAQMAINNFLNEHKNIRQLLNSALSNAFFDSDKLVDEDGSRFDITSFENDIPAPKEWGFDSQPWDYTVTEDGVDNSLVKWDDGAELPVVFSEFPNFAVETGSGYATDKVGWHIFNWETKSGVERVNYSDDYIFVTASGIPDHSYNLFDTTWPHLGKTIPLKITHQNRQWEIPTTVIIPVAADKEKVPYGPVAILRNGVPLYSPKSRESHKQEGVWTYNTMYSASGTTEYGFEDFFWFWRHRDEHGAAVNYNGQYHYYANPTAIYNDSPHQHSPLLGYAFDGVPVYGPQSYENINGTGQIRRMRSSYRLKTGTRVAIGTETVPTGSYDGTYYEDYEYVAGLGDLDEHNGRQCKTPEYPDGIYAYFVTVDEENLPVYPYVIGTTYYGKPLTANYEEIPYRPLPIDTSYNHLGIPNLSIDRQDRDSKDFVRPTHEQWPDELIPISSKEGLQITVQTNNHYTLGSVTDWLSFRIYYDADGETKYYALANATKTTASTAITKSDTEISVADAKVLPEPYLNSLGTGYTVPGVVFIGSERVEYLDIDIANNKLLHCRRGTGTTSVQDHAISTSIFSGDVNNILTYDTETTWSPDATNGLNASTSEQAVFLKNRSGNALA